MQLRIIRKIVDCKYLAFYCYKLQLGVCGGYRTLQQRNDRNSTLLLKRNCYVLCVWASSFFYAHTLLVAVFQFATAFKLHFFETVAVMSRCCNVGKPCVAVREYARTYLFYTCFTSSIDVCTSVGYFSHAQCCIVSESQ